MSARMASTFNILMFQSSKMTLDDFFVGPVDCVDSSRSVSLARALLAEGRFDDLALGHVARHRSLEGVDRSRISFGRNWSSLRRQ